jgi:flagellar motor switch protein FliN
MTSNEPPSAAASGSAEPRGDPYPPVPDLDPQPGLPDTEAEPAQAHRAASLDLVLDVRVRLSVELGRTEIPIRDVVNIGRGSIIELDGTPGAPLDVRVNGVLIGRGEIVVINEERLGLRFVEVVSQAERVSHLR